MSKPSAFRQLLAKADEIGRELCARYADRCCFPLPGTGTYRDVVSYAVLLYLSSWMRWDKSGQMTIYRYAKEYFQGDPDEKRVMYAHEKALLRQSDSFAEGGRRVYDWADFCLFTNSMAHSDPLLTYAVRQTLPFSKYVNDPAFAEAYRKYDEEYARAARITDAVDYVAASVHLFRKEYGFAFSIIAQIARYMSEHGITRFEREPGSRFWSNVLVEDFATGEMLSAPPDVLHYGVYVPFLFDGPVPGQIRGHYMQSEFAARTLYQNIYTRLPFPQEGGDRSNGKRLRPTSEITVPSSKTMCLFLFIRTRGAKIRTNQKSDWPGKS